MQPLEPAPRAVLFDLDDTLCDYSSARNARLRIAFSLVGDIQTNGVTDRDLERMVARSIELHPHGVDHFPELFREFGIGDEAAAQTAADWYRSNRFHGLQLFTDTLAVLRAVRRVDGEAPTSRPRPVGIITNGPADVQRAKIDLLGLRELVDFVLISEEFGVAKPDAAIFTRAIQLAGVLPEEAVFVGDSGEHDIAGAGQLGLSTIWVNRSTAPWEFGSPMPDRQVRSINEVPALVGTRP